ncbi:MAG: hypothetical protein PHE59_01695 [Patescibacteria group bacterium]|nr:hypothetical protein [Patescibacteria group bacterium]MDD5164901.1 hypothetical protein [Patescibacteria group bacterium]MDD5534706.1 hypothetical protein [Patescibacteria group bacterium]
MKEKYPKDKKKRTVNLKEIIAGLHWCPQCQELVSVNTFEDEDNMHINCSKCKNELIVVNFLRYFDKFRKRLK